MPHPVNRPVFSRRWWCYSPPCCSACGSAAFVAVETAANDRILRHFSPLFARAGIAFLVLFAGIALSLAVMAVRGRREAAPAQS
jgi:hypothetical protein